MPSRQWRLLLDTFVLGVVGALSAQAFVFLLRLAERIFLVGVAGYHPPGLPEDGGILREVLGPHGLWLIPVSTTIGGLLSGLLVFNLAPEAEGHGTDAVVHAFHHAQGGLRAQVAPIKMLASAITIGSGGAAGREGPTALISAGVGALYARLGRRTEGEKRTLLLVGAAAGLSAIFRSPIGTAVFAVEVLYGEMEFEANALLYTLLGSIVAYAVNGAIVGWKPLFFVPPSAIVTSAEAYFGYGGLGVVAGLFATALPVLFYRMRDAFRVLPLPASLKPALGGLGVGLIALVLPQVLGGGYGWIQEAIDGHLGTRLLLMLLFAKAIAFSLTVSSGGSGGVFAPSLYVGAMLGAFVAQVFGLSPAPFTIIGMAAVFGAAGRVPIATLLMVTEMTGGYQLLAPAALAVTVSFVLQAALRGRMKYPSLYEAQVDAREDSPAHAPRSCSAVVAR